MLELFVWMLIVLVVWVIFSILRSHDLSAWAKVGWLIFVIVLPFIWRVRGISVNRTSRKILECQAAMTTASSGLFSSGPLK
jgi:hypothetical protein